MGYDLGGIKSISLVDHVKRDVDLTQCGKRFVGLCPFHTENNPSFFIDPDKNLFFCHGCHVGGSIIDYVILSRKLGSTSEKAAQRAAIELLAKEYNIPADNSSNWKSNTQNNRYCYRETPQRESEQEKPEPDPGEMKLLTDILGAFIEIIQPAHSRAVDYMKSRGFTAEFTRGTGITYLEDYNKVSGELERLYDIELLLRTGLYAKPRDKNKAPCLIFFSNRLIIPFYRCGRVTYLQARDIDNQNPSRKYLNLPTGRDRILPCRPIYNEDILDNPGNRIHITEGVFCCLTFQSRGIPAIALCGTGGLPDNILRKLVNFEQVFASLDPDTAGEKATLRIAEQLEEYNKPIYRVPIPAGHDVNSFLGVENG